MKEKLRNKKVVYTIIGIVSVLLVALAVTYAYWLVTKTQTGENEISSACLDISISGEKNDIELTNQFPMSDEDGMKLVPYEFTVTNNCNTSVDYQVALEATGDSSNALKGTSLKVALNDSAKLYSAYPSVETTIDGAYESRVLGYSRLAASGNDGSSDTYSLRIWIDENASISEMNKTFKSRISVTIGQGIESPYEEGTLAYSILSNAGGVNAASEIDGTEYDHRVVASESSTPIGTSFYYWGTDYSYDELTKKYKLSGTITYASVANCQSGTKSCGVYTLRSTSSTGTNATLYKVTDWTSSDGTGYVMANRIEYTNTFDVATSLSNDAFLYKTQDDLGDSYYFRGAITNNYVEFGKYTKNLYEYYQGDNSYFQYETLEGCEAAGLSGCKGYNLLASSGDSMYWRIVRIDGDASIRVIYDGTKLVENGINHNNYVGYNTNNSGMNGYTYEETNEDSEIIQIDSTLKKYIDRWYEENLETNYGKYIADGIFCSDRSVSNYTYYDANYNVITDPTQAAYANIYYGAYQRLEIDKAPSLKCVNKNDRYTVNDTTNGNGLLSNPVGSITADEVLLAGASFMTKNNSYYLYDNYGFFTMTPSSKHFALGESGFVVNQNILESETSGTFRRMRPVITLKADVEFTGDGTIDNPYKIVTE